MKREDRRSEVGKAGMEEEEVKCEVEENIRLEVARVEKAKEEGKDEERDEKKGRKPSILPVVGVCGCCQLSLEF